MTRLRDSLRVLLAVSSAVALAACGRSAVNRTTSPPEEKAFDVTLADATPVTIEKTVALPDPKRGDVGGDVMFLFDRSSSFEDDLATFHERAIEIGDGLRRSFPDVRMGLASFVDAPCKGFGAQKDFGYELNLPLSKDAERLKSAFGGLDIRNGGDKPEAQLEALYQAITGEGRSLAKPCEPASIPATQPGWQPGRLPFIVLSTDAAFHQPTDNDSKYPYPTSAAQVIEVAQKRGASVFVLDSGQVDEIARQVTQATNGKIFPLKGDSSGVVEAIGNALKQSVESASVALVPEGDSAGFVERIEPPKYEGIRLGSRPTLPFKVTFRRAVQPTGAPQEFRFKLRMTINAAPLEAVDVSVVVPPA